MGLVLPWRASQSAIIVGEAGPARAPPGAPLPPLAPPPLKPLGPMGALGPPGPPMATGRYGTGDPGKERLARACCPCRATS